MSNLYKTKISLSSWRHRKAQENPEFLADLDEARQDLDEETGDFKTDLDGDPLTDFDSDLATESEEKTLLDEDALTEEEDEFFVDPFISADIPPPPPPKSASVLRLSTKIAADQDKDGSDSADFGDDHSEDSEEKENLREGLDGFDPGSEELRLQPK